jgi:threonylcarbamoyladenosine tRNA methylthiotransferase MtaB
MRIAFTTLGCKINQYETDLMRQAVAEAGNTLVPFDGDADVYVINTCSVTAKSDSQCRQVIRTAVKRGQGSKVIVTGCYAETRPDEIKAITGVGLVLKNSEKMNICRQLAGSAETGAGLPEAAAHDLEVERVRKRTRGFLKIQDGCDNRCSYCIVPVARGNSRSVPPEGVTGEFDRLVSSGCPEVVLSGIHIGKYGSDLYGNMTLTGLLERLLARRGQTRIRLSSIEPREVTQGIIAMLGQGLCRHLHIPLQSGDDSILSSMNRDYSSGFYMDLLHDVAGKVPDIALGADVMVGYPGEGDKEFLNTYNLIERSPLTHLHVFSYSPRPGTAAAGMKNQVPEQAKKERSEAVRSLGLKKNFDFRKKFLGARLSAVMEEKANRSESRSSGITDNYIRVDTKGDRKDSARKEIPVRIVEVKESFTLAEYLGN